MIYLKEYKEYKKYKDIDSICKKFGIESYTINPDGSIDVDDDVDLPECKFKKLPLQFNRVTGDFICSWNKLTTLKGAPQSVGGDFICRGNKLISLRGHPNQWEGILIVLKTN